MDIFYKFLAALHTHHKNNCHYSHLRKNQPKFSAFQMIKGEYIDDIKYIWIRGNTYMGNGLFRFINLFWFISLLSLTINRLIKKTDLIITSSTYPLDIYPALLLKKINKSCKLIYEPHDLWPMVLYKIGNIKKSHPLVKWMQYAEELSCKKADKVISMHPNNIDHLLNHGCVEEKFFHIPNGVDVSEWAQKTALPTEHSNFLTQSRDSNNLIVTYAGSISEANGIESFIKVAKKMENEDIIFCIVGEGSLKPEMQKYAKSISLTNIKFLPRIDKSAIPSLLEMSDICYVGFVHSPLYKYGISPNKLWDYMMASRPIIMVINSSNNPIKEANCGKTISTGEVQDIVLAIKELIQLPKENRIKLGVNAKKYVIKNNSYKILAKKFIRISKGERFES